MTVVAITGGIGSGKSTVAAQLARKGAIVIDADQIARQVVAPDGASYHALVERFGPGIVGDDGTVDRAALAARVFADPAQRAALNAITHPAIAAAIRVRLDEVAGPGRLVVLDLPLISGATRDFYGLAGVVVVDTPVEVAVRRLVEQRGFSEADAEARVRAQLPRHERRRLADVVVDNSGSREQLDTSIGRLWAWLAGLDGAPSVSVEGVGSVDGAAEEAADADNAEDSQENQ